MCTTETKVVHLKDIIENRANGVDILENSSKDGGILLGDDEGDLLDLICQIDDDIVPLYYRGKWKEFLTDLFSVVQSAEEDHHGEEDKYKKVMEDVTFFIQKIQEDGRIMVA